MTFCQSQTHATIYMLWCTLVLHALTAKQGPRDFKPNSHIKLQWGLKEQPQELICLLSQNTSNTKIFMYNVKKGDIKCETGILTEDKMWQTLRYFEGPVVSNDNENVWLGWGQSCSFSRIKQVNGDEPWKQISVPTQIYFYHLHVTPQYLSLPLKTMWSDIQSIIL